MKITRVVQSHNRNYYIQDLAERNPKTGRPKQKWNPLTKIEDGEQALLDALAAFLGEDAKVGGNMGKCIAAFLKAKLPELKNYDVRKEYERMFEVIEQSFIEFDVGEVTPKDVLDFLSNFAEVPTARRSYKARLSTFFSWCIVYRNDWIKVNPCAEIRLKAPKKRKGRFTAKIYWALYDTLPPIGQCFLRLTYLSRQRPTEIRLLRESQISDGRIHFTPTKTEDSSGADVSVLITPEIQRELERARSLARVKALPGGNAFIIQTAGGTAFTKSGLNSMWKRARAKAGAEGVTTRDIRAYSLAQMDRLGYSREEIKKAAAHKNLATTEGYLDQYREVLSDARLPEPERR
jgi:integrase